MQQIVDAATSIGLFAAGWASCRLVVWSWAAATRADRRDWDG